MRNSAPSHNNAPSSLAATAADAAVVAGMKAYGFDCDIQNVVCRAIRAVRAIRALGIFPSHPGSLHLTLKHRAEGHGADEFDNVSIPCILL